MFLGGPGVLGGQEEGCSSWEVVILVGDCGPEYVGGIESFC